MTKSTNGSCCEITSEKTNGNMYIYHVTVVNLKSINLHDKLCPSKLTETNEINVYDVMIFNTTVIK